MALFLHFNAMFGHKNIIDNLKKGAPKSTTIQKTNRFLLRAEWDQNPCSQMLKILLKALQKPVTAACLCQWFWNEMLNNHI